MSSAVHPTAEGAAGTSPGRAITTTRAICGGCRIDTILHRGVCPDCGYRNSGRHTVKPRKVNDREVAELYLSGLSMLNVAKRLGVGATAIHRSLNRSGTPKRPSWLAAAEKRRAQTHCINGHLLPEPDHHGRRKCARCSVEYHARRHRERRRLVTTHGTTTPTNGGHS